MKKLTALLMSCLLILGVSGCSKKEEEEKFNDDAFDALVESFESVGNYKSFEFDLTMDMLDKSINEDGEKASVSINGGVDTTKEQPEMAFHIDMTMSGESMEDFMAIYFTNNNMYASIMGMNMYSPVPADENPLDDLKENVPGSNLLSDDDKETMKKNMKKYCDSLKLEEKDGKKVVTMVLNDTVNDEAKDEEEDTKEMLKAMVGKDIVFTIDKDKNLESIVLEGSLPAGEDGTTVEKLSISFANMNKDIDFEFPDFSTYVLSEDLDTDSMFGGF